MICIHADTVIIYNEDDNASCGEGNSNNGNSSNSETESSDDEESEPPNFPKRRNGLKHIR